METFVQSAAQAAQSAQQSTKKSAEQFAENYGIVKDDGVFGPLIVGNVNVMSSREGQPLPKDKWRIIYNVNAKTVANPRGLSYSHPYEWGQKFNPGMLVNIIMEKGRVEKLVPAPVEAPVKPAKAAAPVAAIVEPLQEESTNVFTQVDGLASFEAETTTSELTDSSASTPGLPDEDNTFITE